MIVKQKLITMKQFPVKQTQFDVFAQNTDLQLSRKMMNLIRGGDGGDGGVIDPPTPPPPPPDS